MPKAIIIDQKKVMCMRMFHTRAKSMAGASFNVRLN